MKSLAKTILAVLAVGLLSCGLFCQQAQAIPIRGGQLKLGGFVTLSIDPDTNAIVLTFDHVMTTSATGQFSSIPNGTIPSFFEPLIFNPTDHTFGVGGGGLEEWFFIRPFEFNHPMGQGVVTLGPPTGPFSRSG